MNKKYKAIPVKMGRWITALNSYDSVRARRPNEYAELYGEAEAWRNVLTMEDKRVGLEVMNKDEYNAAIKAAQEQVESLFIRLGVY